METIKGYSFMGRTPTITGVKKKRRRARLLLHLDRRRRRRPLLDQPRQPGQLRGRRRRLATVWKSGDTILVIATIKVEKQKNQ